MYSNWVWTQYNNINIKISKKKKKIDHKGTTCFNYAEEINLIIHVHRDGLAGVWQETEMLQKNEGSLWFGELFLAEEQQEPSTADKC